VGSDLPNKLGLYDMHGNVWQWTDSLWQEGATARVCRGGSWDFEGDLCQANFRRGNAPDYKGRNLGLRLVRVPVR
jgi:formylglycine-generating enzyme required for sulfatase activity